MPKGITSRTVSKYSETQYPTEVTVYTVYTRGHEECFKLIPFSNMKFLEGGRYYEGEGDRKNFLFGKGYKGRNNRQF